MLLEDVSGEFAGLVVQGPDAGAFLTGLDEHGVRAEPDGWTIARSFTGDPGYLRLAPRGVFAADMRVALVNDGPVTIWIDSRRRE